MYSTLTNRDAYVAKFLFYDYDTKYNTLKVIVPHVRKIKRQNSCHYETSDNSKLTNYMKEMRLKKVGL